MSAMNLKSGCVKECPACPHRLLTRNESLAQKQQWIEKRLGEFANLIQPIKSEPEEKRWNYRKKVCLAAEFHDAGWRIGIRKRDSIIAIHDCPVQNAIINRNIQLLIRNLPPPEDFPLAYFIQSGAQITLVIKSREIVDMSWFDNNISLALESNGVDGLWLHMHPCTGKKIFGKGGWQLVFGKSRSVNDANLIYGPSSFQQVLPALYNGSLKEASDFISPDSNHTVIDLYCGVGASMKKWMETAARVIGVELGGEAIECARINVPQATLLRGTCTQRIPQLNEFISQLQQKQISLYANPPRTGLEEEVLEWIAAKLKPGKMAYLSCSAGTLYRDLVLLSKKGFKVQSIIPYDFFPQTLHVEMLALIEGNSNL
jgi:23S rRNA (uracil1939-C5)-methyltransferase